MLRITPTAGAKRAKDYFTESLERGDYYTESQELAGKWGGKGADLLGLEGDVTQSEFFRLCENRHPHTGKPLTLRTNANRRVGYDVNYHCPKSVSLGHALLGDRAIEETFRDASSYAMSLIETDVQTRVRRGGADYDRTTGNLVWADFIHQTARPVGGIPDPHLHCHTFCINATHDAEEAAWKAVQLGTVKADGEFYQAAFQSRLRQNLEEAGYRTRTKKWSFELEAMSDDEVSLFSRRTRGIEATAKAKGIVDPERKSELGARTREAKAKGLTMPELRTQWREWLGAEGLEQLRNAKSEPRSREWVERNGRAQARLAITHAMDHLFERDSVVKEKALFAAAFVHSQGAVTLDHLQDELASRDIVSEVESGQRYVTTKALIAEENDMIRYAVQGRGVSNPYSLHFDAAEASLTPSQALVAKAVLSSEDRVTVVRGAAGVGKTWTMKTVVDEIQKAPSAKVFAAAPTTSAADELNSQGFANAQTVQRLLTNERSHRKLQGQTIWIDEVGLLGVRQVGEVFRLAERHEARLILTGDDRQHSGVLRGSPLALLEKGGAVPTELTEIRRQSGGFKRIVQKISQGRFSSAFAELDERGWVKEMDTAEAHREIASEISRSLLGKKGRAASRPMAIAPTHKERRELTNAIRKELKAAKWISGSERSVTSLVSLELTEAERRLTSSFEAGQVLFFYKNTKGYRAGERATVSRVDEAGRVWLDAIGKPPTALNTEQPDRYDVFKERKLELAAGDLIRITQNGRTRCRSHQLRSGSEHEVRGFDRGDFVLMNGWVVPKHYGHLDHAYVRTSVSSQSKDAGRVLVAQSAHSFGATNAHQFYVSVSRARDSVAIYTDDVGRLAERILKTDKYRNASDINHGRHFERVPHERDKQEERERSL